MKKNEISKEDISKSLQEAIVNILYDKVEKAVKEKNVKTLLVVGGVSANKGLRKKFENFSDIEVHFPKMEYCTDNAAMIGVAAYYELKNKKIDDKKNNYDVDAISTKEEK